MGLSHLSPAPSLAGGRATVNIGLRYLVTVVCAGSAGVHAALVQPHLRESGVPLAAAFAAAALALALMAVAVRRPQHDSWAPACASALLGVLAGAYDRSRSSGIPLLIGQPEQLDPLGALATAAELTGAFAGALLISRKDRA
ncbi:MAG: hypothetical protein ACM3ML_32595 [Micromonosporaceae bacterium]